MQRAPASFRRFVALATLALHLGGGWMHAFGHASHQEPVALCDDAGQGHWHETTAHEHEARHACVQCQRLAAGGPVSGAFRLFGGAGPGASVGSVSQLQFHSVAFLPSAPHRGPPAA